MLFASALVLWCAADIPPVAKRYVEQATALQAKRVRESEEQLEEAQNALRRRGHTRATARALRSKIDELKKRIRELRSGELPVPIMDPFSLRVGQIGRFDMRALTVKAAQVLAPDQMHVVPERTATRINFIGLEARQSFFTEVGDRILVKGVSTAGITDGRSVNPGNVFEVTGTESYRTVVGSTKTIFVVEPFDMELIKPFIAKPKYRTWKDGTGKFTVVAEFLSYEDGQVRLKRKDNHKIISVPLSRLSGADEAYVEQRR